MSQEKFWAIIHQNRRNCNDCEALANALQSSLSQLSPAEIIEFDFLFRQKVIEAYRWDLWGIAYLINGGCSDDSFEYFRYWLIGQGQTVYETVLANPEAILDFIDEETDIECESLIYASQYAYEALVGAALPSQELTYPQEPAGEQWEEEDLEHLFPRVAAQY